MAEMNVLSRNPDHTYCFTGHEVEHSPYLGVRTLFVSGYLPISRILELFNASPVGQIYLAANQSHGKASPAEWANLALALLQELGTQSNVEPAVAVTVDVLVTDLQAFIEALPPSACPALQHLHVMISVPVPGLVKLENFSVKLDDKIGDPVKVVNPGVWVVQKSVLDKGFTPWAAYSADSAV